MKIGPGARSADRSYLDGQCLIAMPGMRDERFERTVIYLCAHSDEGAMGLILNREAPDMQLGELLVQLDIVEDLRSIRVREPAETIQILRGGPVETGRGFVLHSADWYVESGTMLIDGSVCLTHTVDILRAIASGEGPARALLALGYAGWGPGQLEDEIQRNAWLNVPADEALVFRDDLTRSWDAALAKLRVDPALLSGIAGRA